MSNRQVAVLVLTAFFSAAGALIYLFFVRNVSYLEVSVEGPETARVSLQKGRADMLAVECEKRCAVEKIPPFEYELVVRAEGFVEFREPIKITNSSRLFKEISLVRDVRTESYRREKSDAIAEITEKRALLSESGATESGREVLGSFSGSAYFFETFPKFRLVSRSGSADDTVIFESETGAIVRPVYDDFDGLLYLEAEGNSVLIDLASGKKEFPKFPSGVEKVSRLENGTITVTASGSTSVFDSKNGSVEAFAPYADFVLLPDSRVLGVVPRGDAFRSAVHDFSDAEKSRVVIDSPTAGRKTVYETDDTIKYVWFESGSVILGADDGSKEVLVNYE